MTRSLLIAGLIFLGLTLGMTAWAANSSTQDIVTQIQNYTATGDIQEAAAAEDLLSMLSSVDSAISQGDHVAAQSLLTGFVHAVQGLEGKLISSAAATGLVNAANALSLGL